MSYRFVLSVALFAACTVDDVPMLEIQAQATKPAEVGPPTQEPVPEGTAEYTWKLVLAPETSEATDPVGGSIASFLPDVRGTYLVERWMTYGLAESLTHRFVVRAEGIRPTAVVRGSAGATVGTAVMVDGSQSSSAEGLTLTFRWRLTERPRDSTAILADAQAPTTSFVPDKAGDYGIELATFDGELWSTPSAFLPISVQ